jgi:PGF-pre-PGF domain-containing protein
MNMKKLTIIITALLVFFVGVNFTNALTCTADSTKTIELDGTQTIQVSCTYGEGDTGITVDVSGTYTQTCIDDTSGDYPSTATINSGSTTATFTFRAISMACQNNVNDRKITWKFTPSSGTLADKYTTITITSPLSITATFVNSPYSSQPGSSKTITLMVSTTANTDINNIYVDVSGSSSALGLTDKSISKIAASEGEKTQYVSWTITAPSTEGTYNLHAVVTSQNADSDTATGSLVVSSETSGGTSGDGGTGGGGAAGGGAGGAGAVEISETQSLASILAGSTGILTYLQEDKLGIQKISITAKDELKSVIITVKAHTDKPAEVTTPAGVVYSYLTITALNVNETSLTKAEINFKINKTWIIENNIDKTTVALNRFKDNAWEKLPTQLLSEDNQYVYYSAETPGFSVFAITAEKVKGETPVVVCNNNGICDSGETPENCPNDCQKTVEKEKEKPQQAVEEIPESNQVWILVIVLIAVLLLIAYEIYHIKKKRSVVL